MRTFEKQRQEHKLGYLLVCISVLFISCQSFKIIPDIYEIMFCRYEYNSNFFTNCLPIPLNIITFQKKEGYTQQNVSMKCFKIFCILCTCKIINIVFFVFHFVQLFKSSTTYTVYYASNFAIFYAKKNSYIQLFFVYHFVQL